MALYTTAAGGILTPEQIGPLIVEPLQRASVAMQISTVIPTASKTLRFPRITADVQAAWTPEGQEINPTDATVAELEVTPKKLAALSIISAELAADSSPAATELVGQSIARDLAKKVDSAYFAASTANGPDGIDGIGWTLVSASGLTNLDAFAEAISEAEQVGATITSWVAHPRTELALMQAKTGSGLNTALLGPDATSPTKRAVLGIPLYWSNYVDEGCIWGIDRAKAFVVLRTNVELDVDDSVFFTSHRRAIRAVTRIGFGFPHEEAIVKVGVGGS